MPPRKKRMNEKDLVFVGTTTYTGLEEDIVHRYFKYRCSNNRYWVRCAEILHDENGVLCKCDMELTREDNFRAWLMRGNSHDCRPGEPVNQNTLHSYEKNNDESSLDIISESYLYKEMGLFTGKKNLSLNLLTSEEFYKLAIDFITYGLQIAGDKHAEEKALKSFKNISRDKLRYIMTTEAFKQHRAMLSKFAQIPYCCIAMDEGTTSGNKNLHFVIESPLTDLKSYPYTIVKMKGGNTKCYLESIPRGFLPLDIANISVGSVVIDGNTAQKKAWQSTSLLQTNISDIDKIIVAPCLCHRVHNSYKYIAKHNADLSTIVNELHLISKLCIERQDQIGAVCPQHMETRWANDYDIIKFILDHQDKILHIRPNLPLEKFTELEKVLRVFKCLISKFENPKTLFSSAFITLERAICCLYELGSKHNVQFGRELAESLSKYTLESKGGDIWALTYTFTPQGREDFRQRAIKQRNPFEKTYLHYFKIEDYPQFIDNIDIIPNSLPIDEDIIMTTNGELVTDTIDESDDENTASPEGENENDDSDILPTDSEMFNKNHLVAAKEFLKTIIDKRNITKEEKTYSLNAYNTYIDSEEDPFKDYHMLKESNYSWLQIRNAINEMKHIADIAMRLVSSCLSEASCERAISKQRLIHTNRRMRSNPDLLDARRILESI